MSIKNRVLNSDSFDIKDYDSCEEAVESILTIYKKQNIRLERIIKQSDSQQLKLIKLYEKLEKAQEIIKLDSITDRWTTLYNRNHIYDSIKLLLEQNKIFSVLLIELSNFSHINSQFGYKNGDAVLKQFASLLKQVMPKNSILGRWESALFVVILIDVSSDNAISKGENLIEKNENYFYDSIGNICVNIGVCDFTNFKTVEAVIQKCETALNDAKNSGSNTISI